MVRPPLAAPDEDILGKAKRYPIGTAKNWMSDEAVRVGSFTHQGEIPGIFNGRANELAASNSPMPLGRAESKPPFRWDVQGRTDLTVDDYLSRNRIMALMVVKDGVIQLERYQYDRTPEHRFLSQSMAKSITSLAVGIALGEGKIKSLDDRADVYVPELAGTLYGETTIRNLLRMASGARYAGSYKGEDDNGRWIRTLDEVGIVKAAPVMNERKAPQGTRFNYASAETDMLAAVLRGATGMSLSEYLTPRLWQPIGAQTSALWRTDRTGLERASGNFNATLHDFARLGVVLANDGVRPDDPQRRQIVPRDYLLDATEWRRNPSLWRPGSQPPSELGYGYQFWLVPSERRQFVLIGIFGQMMFIDPERKLVMVQTGADAVSHPPALARDAVALWRGVVRHYDGQ